MVQIFTKRFLLRDLTESDITETYLNWFDDEDTRTSIVTAATRQTLDSLRKYVNERINRSDILFLGIFDKESHMHIGNIKYEPLCSDLGYAIMGILIGDPNYRGKGVAQEVLIASGKWLKKKRNISQIILGVDNRNTKAIGAYQKVGFKLAKTKYLPDHPSTMVWDLKLIDEMYNL